MQHNENFFDEKLLISERMWPLRSSDLTRLDFFFWSYLKNHVYLTLVANTGESKAHIMAEIASIDVAMLKTHFQ